MNCVMLRIEGFDYDTISKKLSIPLSSVKWRLNQSKSLLKEEIKSDLGTAAEYVEDVLVNLVAAQSVKKFGNKYQTMFPIWNEKENTDVFEGNIRYVRYAKEQARDIIGIVVPVLSEERGDIRMLFESLAPVFSMTNALQNKIYSRSCETV